MDAIAKPLQGKAAIVTGSVRRIGRATALALSRLGASVVIHSRESADEAAAVRAEIEAEGGRAIVHLADVVDEHAVAGLIEETLAAFGQLDVLVNNAGIRADSSMAEMSFAEWRQVTGIILDGAFLCSRAAIPHMKRQGGGRIVNIGGVSAHIGAPNRAHVVTAKAGIVGFTRALAHELARDGITANCVVPGKIGGKRSVTAGKGIDASPLVAREGVPEDVARIVAHLCLPESDFITGQTVHVSGGMFMP